MATACADDGGGQPATGTDTAQTPTDPHTYFDFPTGSFTVPGGEERFFCFAMTLEDDLTVDHFELKGKPVVHHMVMSETIAPEPDGFSECNVLFRATWMPVFVAGAGDATLAVPEGTGFVFKKGTQILIQLHLLNATPDEVTDEVTVRMRIHEEALDSTIAQVVFGTTNLALPPLSESEVVDSCTVTEDMEIFAVFPHMHYLGLGLTVEVGQDDASMTTVYSRTPWDFDNQAMDPVSMNLKKGDVVRTTCRYNNDRDEIVTFGESTLDEMCIFLVYAIGPTDRFGVCFGGGTGDYNLFPEGCGDDPPNEAGLGASCTQGGGECQDGLSCSHDLISTSGPGLCISFNACETSEECGGGGAVCCSLAIAGDINVCVPQSCLITGCKVL